MTFRDTDIRMTQSVCITGGNSGIGFAAAKLFKNKGYEVTIVGRSQEKLKQAQEDLGNVKIEICDLSKKDSMDKFVGSCEAFDILVNNAGVYMSEYEETDAGQEMTYGINHLGTMYLTLEMLKHHKVNGNGSIVIVSSALHKKGVKDLDFFDKISAESYDGWATYNQSKLYNLLFALTLTKVYLPEKFPDMHYSISSVHPGYIPSTNIMKRPTGSQTASSTAGSSSTTPEDGASRIFKAATDPESNGKYIGNIGFEDTSDLAKDDDFAKQLWLKSARTLNIE